MHAPYEIQGLGMEYFGVPRILIYYIILCFLRLNPKNNNIFI